MRNGATQQHCGVNIVAPVLEGVLYRFGWGIEVAMPNLQHWDDITEQQSGSAVSKRAVAGAGVSLVRVAVAAGTDAARHSHPFEQFVQVISGRGTLETSEGRQPFSAGSLFHFAPGAWHAARFDEDTILVETNLVL